MLPGAARRVFPRSRIRGDERLSPFLCIWLYIARESGSVDTAIRILQGALREDLSPELRSFTAGNYVIAVQIHCGVAILGGSLPSGGFLEGSNRRIRLTGTGASLIHLQ